MIPAAVRPFLPLILQSAKQELATGDERALALSVTQAIRAECTPAEQGKLAKVLQLTAERLGV